MINGVHYTGECVKLKKFIKRYRIKGIGWLKNIYSKNILEKYFSVHLFHYIYRQKPSLELASFVIFFSANHGRKPLNT